MKKIIKKKKNKIAETIIGEAEKNLPVFLKRIKEEELTICRAQTIKPETGLRPFNI